MSRAHFLFLLALLLSFATYAQQPPASLLILNAQVADGTGAPLRKANVRISRDRIAQIGDLRPEEGEPTLDARGLVLAPGFIDVFNYSGEALVKDPQAPSITASGITTAVFGAGGDSPWPIIQWVRSVQGQRTALNFSVFAGYKTIRLQVMGKDEKRAATPTEMERMQQLLEQALNQQALGLSIPTDCAGITLPPSGKKPVVNGKKRRQTQAQIEPGTPGGGESSVTCGADELAALSKVVVEHDGIYLADTFDFAGSPIGTLDRALGHARSLALPEAIRRITSFPAERLGFKERGVIREGAYADLVLFDPDSVTALSVGLKGADPRAVFKKVFVSGVLVWDDGKPTSARPGVFLGRHGVRIPLLN